MQARHAARELALILFSQFRTMKDFNKLAFQDIIVKSVRILTNSSIEDLNGITKEILSIKNFISEYETNHPLNIERPIDAIDKPVPLPMTSDMQNKLDNLLDISERTILALEIAEMSVLEENSNVKSLIMQLTNQYKTHKKEIDDLIKKYAIGWNFKRIFQMDKDILRIAICELLYIKEVPVKSVIDEALELANKYSTDESANFINGILGKIIIEKNLK